MEPAELVRHVYAVQAMGFTRIPAQVTGRRLEDLRELTDRGLAEARSVYGLQGKLKYTSTAPGYEGCRCLYVWGDAAVRLLDLDIIHDLAGQLLNQYRLWDLSALSVTPWPADQPSPAGTFHRDIGLVDTRVAKPPFLWCFLCLDDTTPRNGATWVVPGSHHVDYPRTIPGESFRAFIQPMAQQVCAQAGDLVVLDATMLHAAGHNATNAPRRLINIGLCSEVTPPLVDHWAVAGPAIQPRVSARVQTMMRSNTPGLDKTWDALPPGWKTASSD